MGNIFETIETPIQNQLDQSFEKLLTKLGELFYVSCEEFAQFLTEKFDSFLNSFGDIFSLSLQSLAEKIENQNDVHVSPDSLDAIVPHLQDLQAQLTNPNENISSLLAGVTNVQNLLSGLSNEINIILNNSFNDPLEEVINDNVPQLINLVIDVFGESTIINEFSRIARSVLNELIQTFAEELKVVFEVFHLSVSNFLLSTSNTTLLNEFLNGFNSVLNAGITLLASINEITENDPNVLNFEDFESFLEYISLLPAIEDLSWAFQHMSEGSVLMWSILFGCIMSFSERIMPSVYDLFVQLPYSLLEYGQLIVGALADISGSIQRY